MTSVLSRPKSRRVFGLSRHEVAHELVWLLAIVAATAVLQRVGALHPIERFIIDVFAATEEKAPARFTAIIAIDEASFSAPEFRRQLRHDALANLIIAADLAEARVIVVDVDTDVTAVRMAMGDRKPTAPVVWAAVSRPCPNTTCLIPTDPLSSVSERPPAWVAGLTTLLHDGDYVLRRYKQAFETAVELPDGSCKCSGDPMPTLARAAAAAYRGDLPALKLHDPKPEALLLNWRSDRWFTKRFAAFEVLRHFKEDWWHTASEPMRGKVVLIGGTFSAGHDVHQTPAGEMTGVEVLAHIVESELAGRGMAPFHEIYVILIDFVVGLALVAVNIAFRSPTRRRLAVNALLVFALPLVASWAMYRFSVYWASLAPVTAGVLLHQWHQRTTQLVPRSADVH